MKKVLSLLVAFVFLQVQVWASGPPNYGALSNSVSGTFAGVLIGSAGVNGLGLFQIGLPTAGLGSGTFAFFAGGGAFFGTVVALGDAEENTMSGIFKGELDIQETGVVGGAASGTGAATGGTATTLEIPVALMGGQFVAKITGAQGGSINPGARITGTAAVTVTASNAIDPFGSGTVIPLPAGVTTGDTALTIDGFEQSSAVTGQVSLSSLTGTTPAGGG